MNLYEIYIRGREDSITMGEARKMIIFCDNFSEAEDWVDKTENGHPDENWIKDGIVQAADSSLCINVLNSLMRVRRERLKEGVLPALVCMTWDPTIEVYEF